MPIFGGFFDSVGDFFGDLFGGGGGGGAVSYVDPLREQLQSLTNENHMLQQQNQLAAASAGGYQQPQSSGFSLGLPEIQTHQGSTDLFIDDIKSLSTFQTPQIFSNFLAQQRRPGGYLASGQQSREFSAQAGGYLGQLAGQRRDLRSDLGRLNPTFGRRTESNLEFGALGNILNARVGASAASAERNFLADQAFANALAATDVAQKQQTLQGLQFNVDISNQIRAAREGARSATKGALIGGGLSAAGQIGAAFI